MNKNTENKLIVAIREADHLFGASETGGTKVWLRGFFLPALRKYGLVIIEKPAHNCPDWDYDWILPGSPEMEACLCEFKEGEIDLPE